MEGERGERAWTVEVDWGGGLGGGGKESIAIYVHGLSRRSMIERRKNASLRVLTSIHQHPISILFDLDTLYSLNSIPTA